MTVLFLLKRQNISYKFDQNDFWCSHVLKIRYNSLFNICWYWWNPSLFVVLLYRFSKSISLNKMPAVIFYLNVHGNHILPQYQFLFSLQINFHFIQPVELFLDNGIYIWTFFGKRLYAMETYFIRFLYNVELIKYCLYLNLKINYAVLIFRQKLWLYHK